MALLTNDIVQQVKERLADLPDPVQLMVFTSPDHCDYCKEIVQLAQEVADTSDKLTAAVYDIRQAPEKAAPLHITMTPAMAIIGARDYGLRFYGIPSGHEFNTLLAGIERASYGKPDLDETTQAFLKNLSQPVHLQVFVTPTCPHCPRGAILAYDMAVASDKVVAEVVESMEFQDLAMEFNVMGVPLTVVNGKERIEGAAPPPKVVEGIKKALA